MATQNFIIDPSSVSQAAIKANLIAFLDAAPDTAKWKDFFSSSTGTLLVEMIAALGALINYNVTVGRREGYLQYAQGRSSAIGGGESLGYSSYRGRNAVLRLTIVPTVTTLWPKYTVIGTVKDQQIIVLEDKTVTALQTTTVDVILGTLESEEISVDSAAPAQFRFITGPVSKDYRVKLNGTPVTSSESIIDMISEAFVALTNVFDSLDVHYLNLSTFATRYTTGDIIAIEYVVLKNIVFDSTDLKFDYGTLVSYEVISPYISPETVESIRVNAPLYHETQLLIRGREDYLKIFKSLDFDIQDTNYTDVSPAIVDLSYVEKNSCLFSDAELAAFISQLSKYRPMGVQPPTISHPTLNFLDVSITVKLTATGDVTTDVRTILAKDERSLGISIVFDDLEQSMEELSYTKIARVAYNPTTWLASRQYRHGKHVIASPDNGKIFKANAIVYRSGAIEPVWPNVALGDTVSDSSGRVMYTSVAKPTPAPSAWSANTRYYDGNLVSPSTPISIPANPPLQPDPIPLAFQITTINKSNADTPAVPATGAHNGATYTADVAGTGGNDITLEFDGAATNQTVIDTWNTVHPTNTVSITTGSPSTVSPATTLILSGGTNLISGEPVWPGSILPPC